MDLNPIDEKKLKVIRDYPMLSVCAIEAAIIIGMVIFIILPDRKEYNEHLKQDLLKAEKKDEKQTEMLNFYQTMRNQYDEMKTFTYRTDTTKSR